VSIISCVSPIAITPFEVNDIVRLKKPHACGGTEWQVVRVGADIGLRCQTCGRRVLLPRRELQRRLAQWLGQINTASGNPHPTRADEQ
jgi:hypothetical protein